MARELFYRIRIKNECGKLARPRIRDGALSQLLLLCEPSAFGGIKWEVNIFDRHCDFDGFFGWLLWIHLQNCTFHCVSWCS